MKQLLLAAMLCIATPLLAQQQPDFSTMSHNQVRKYVREHGYQTRDGKTVKIGDKFTLGKGTMPDKSFAFIYQSAAAFGSGTSLDLSTKAYLPSSGTNRKATVKEFMTTGMKGSGYTVLAVIDAGQVIKYWVEIDNALEANEITPE